MPVTLIWGAQDQTCPITGEGEALVRKSIPHGRLLVLPDAGHGVLYEEAKVVAEEITATLNVHMVPDPVDPSPVVDATQKQTHCV